MKATFISHFLLTILLGLICLNGWGIYKLTRLESVAVASFSEPEEDKVTATSPPPVVVHTAVSRLPGKTCLDGNMLPLFVYREKYDKRWVRVQGCLTYEFEMQWLSLSSEGGGDLWVFYEPDDNLSYSQRQEFIKQFDGKYVTVEGIYHKRGWTYLSTRFSTGVISIRKIEECPTRERNSPVSEHDGGGNE